MGVETFASWLATATGSTVSIATASAVLGTIVNTTFILGVGAYSQSQARKAERRARRQALEAIQDRTMMVRSAVADRPRVYGRARLSGPFMPLGVSGQYGEKFHFIVCLAGPLDAVEEIWFGDTQVGTVDANGWATQPPFARSTLRPTFVQQPVDGSGQLTIPHGSADWVTQISLAIANPAGGSIVLHAGNPATDAQAYSSSYSGDHELIFQLHESQIGAVVTVNYSYTQTKSYLRVKAYLGQPGQAADDYLKTELPGVWSDDHVGHGVSYIAVTAEYEPDVFPSGILDVSAVVRGERVYDPRDATTTWSENPQLCLRDYLVNELGCDSSTEIDNSATFFAEANACDEQISVATGTEKRYTFNGALSTAALPADNIEVLLASMMGTATYSGGKWRTITGVWHEPEFELDADDLADDDIVIQPRPAADAVINGARGRYLNEHWTEEDFPAWISSTYVAEDAGDEMLADLDLRSVRGLSRAQRIAKRHVLWERQALIIEARWKSTAYKVTPGSAVLLNLPWFGFDQKPFICLDRDFDPASNTLKLLFREAAEAIDDWDFDEARTPDPAPNTNLPNPRFVSAPFISAGSGTAYVTRLADGSQQPFLRIYWPELDVSVETIELWWRRPHEIAWKQAIVGVERRAYDIYDVAHGETFIVQARSVNGLGVRSDWFSITVVINVNTPTNFIGPGMVGTPEIKVSAATDVYTYTYTGSAINVEYASGAGTGGSELLDRVLIKNDTDVPITVILTGHVQLSVTGQGLRAYFAISRQFNSNEVLIDLNSPPWSWIGGYASVSPLISWQAAETRIQSMFVTTSQEIPAHYAIGVTLVARVSPAYQPPTPIFTSAYASEQTLRVEVIKR